MNAERTRSGIAAKAKGNDGPSHTCCLVESVDASVDCVCRGRRELSGWGCLSRSD